MFVSYYALAVHGVRVQSQLDKNPEPWLTPTLVMLGIAMASLAKEAADAVQQQAVLMKY